MSMHLKNSRDMMVPKDEGWWSSKTSLEQKLIIFTAILSILCFCLIITVIVLDKGKCSATCVITTDSTNETSTASVSEPSKPTEPPTPPPTTPPTPPPANATESPENAAETRPPEPLKEKEEKNGEVVPAA